MNTVTENTGLFSRIGEMFENVVQQEYGSLMLVLLIGIIFGGIIQYTRVDKFEKIAGFSMLKDTIVPKMLFLTVGLSSIGLYFMIESGYAHYHVKPILWQGLVIGGILFGIAMAILGKCPGTGPVSIAEGRIDVLVGAIGGLLGGLLFTLYYDDIFKPLMGESAGKLTLPELFPGSEHTVVLIFGIAVTLIAILIPKVEMFDEADLDKLPADQRPDLK
ncbi:YeeE/YedE thiosulfate transporter family protein [Sulfurovum mangrovi]|uniref:YeeE/YedE thiosulfate transporter family protein n=1 Tax=Sulfurovum mangrovi TaxID=2893889 RepID=UPI001E5C43BD|nr:YeeE/YedE thiosulfate transporter family protein [Sulfurovum mangrovi]UFH59388.1 YeeE/YedE family protein [Sulfurovum mangrovi]